MKKAVVLFAAGMLLFACLPAFSQTTQTAQPVPKDAYVKTVHIMKIWMHQLGYKIQFWTSKSTVGELYVPITWFNKGPASKADITFGNTPEYPYFSVFWVDGTFDHIMIYAMEDFHSPTWGVLESPTDLSSQFNVQDLPKEY
jgi:hypothetical protein